MKSKKWSRPRQGWTSNAPSVCEGSDMDDLKKFGKKMKVPGFFDGARIL